MDPWKQRDRFMELVDAKIASGATVEEIAQAIGLKTVRSLVHGYRYDHARMPKRTTIQLAARYFGVSETEIYGEDPAEISQEALARAIAIQAMGADDVALISPEKMLEAYKVALATARAVLAQ